MKIIHVCLSCFYYDNFSYQENELVAQNVKDGHDVLVLSSNESHPKFSNNNNLIAPYIGNDGAYVIRLPYRLGVLGFISRKLRIHTGVLDVLNKFNPDVIFFHGLCGWELITVANYVSLKPGVKFYIDSHTDFNNSAKSFISKYILHFLFYRTIARYSSKFAKKVFCVSIETLNFAKYFYGINKNKLEFYPLGGEIFDDQQMEISGKNIRDKFLLSNKQRLFVQTGKMGRKKKLIDSLNAFKKINDNNLKYIIAGVLEDDIKNEVFEIINSDNRIEFVGWLEPDALRDILFAADVYVQPGSQSATMQMSLCCGCAVILDDVISHVPYVNGNGWLINGSCTLAGALKEAACMDYSDLRLMQSKSLNFARDKLDYKKLAERIYE